MSRGGKNYNTIESFQSNFSPKSRRENEEKAGAEKKKKRANYALYNVQDSGEAGRMEKQNIKINCIIYLILFFSLSRPSQSLHGTRDKRDVAYTLCSRSER
jgi:hypothetical protein